MRCLYLYFLLLLLLCWCGQLDARGPRSGTGQPSSYPTSQPTYIPFQANVTAFDFDLSTGNLTMYFNDRMNMSTMNVEKISLHNMPFGGAMYSIFSLTGKHRFRQNNNNQDNGTIVSVFLTSDDYAQLVMNEYPIFTNASTSFLSLEEGVMIALRNQSSMAISVTAPLPVQNFYPDTLPPFLISYELNMQVGYLSLVFSEPIDMSTFTIVGLAVQGSRNVKLAPEGKNQYFALVDDGWNVSSVSDYNRQVRLTLGEVNMNEIKRQMGLATTRESTWLSAYQPFVNDTHGNPVSMKAFDAYNGLNAERYWADTSPPGVKSWEIDMKTCSIAIFFTETIYRNFFNFSGVILTNNDPTDPLYLHVENPINTTTLDHPFLRFQLSPEQVLELQNYDNFCTHNEDCFLILKDGLVVDTSLAQNRYYSNGIATESNPLGVRRLQPDTVRPKLIAFDMDVQSLYQRIVMTLSFSKIVNVSTFQPAFLTLQSEANLGIHTEFLPLSQHVSSIRINTTKDSKDIVMTIYNPVVHILQLSGYLGKASYYTYLACTFELVRDRVVYPIPNQVVDIPQFDALQVRHLTTDRTPPVLLSWALDLERGVLSLNFSRPIDLSTIHPQEAILFSQGVYLPLSTKFLVLTNLLISDFHRTRTGPRTSYVELELTTDDMLYLASYTDFCTSVSSCYLSFSSSFVGALEDYDSLNGDKSFVPVQSVSFLSCASLVTPTRLVSVWNVTVDMTTLDVYLDFSVPVPTALINVSAIGFWVNDSATVYIHYLSSDAYISPSNAVVQNVTVHLSYQDRVRLQLRPPLLTSLNTSIVTFQSTNTVMDVYGNLLVDHSLWDKNGQGLHYFPASYFQEDTEPPSLLAVYAEENTYTNVTLYFSEAILPYLLQLGGIHAFKRSTGSTYSLENAIVLYPSQETWFTRTNFITLDLTPVKGTLSSASIFTRQSNTYVYLRREGTVKDATKGQFLNNTASFSGTTSSLKEGATFVSFRLDLSQRMLLLELPMVVNISSFFTRGFTLLTPTASHRFDTFDSFTYPDVSLTPEAFMSNGASHLLRIVYSLQDHQSILSIVTAQDMSSIRLSISEEAMTDGMGRILSRSPSLTLTCVHIVYDDIPPYISSFTLDLNSGFMTLYLSKPVDISTMSLLPNNLVLTPAQFTDAASEYGLRVGEMVISTASLSYAADSYWTNRTNEVILDLNVYPETASLKVGLPHMTTREEIMATLRIDRSSNNVHLRVPNAGIAYDMSSTYPPLPMPAIASADALLSSSLTRDTTAPYLVAYTLNMNARKLVLNFSEAINVSSLTIDSFTLAAKTTSPSENYTLSSFSSYIDPLALTSPTNFVTINLGKEDVDNMMRRARRLVLSPEQAYLSFLAGTFQDLATPTNDNEVVFYRYGIPVTNFVYDKVAPVLVSYNLSMDDGSMSMLFSEVVDCQSFDMSRVFFQSSSFLGALGDGNDRALDDNNLKMYLTNSSRCLGPRRYETQHKIQLSAKDLIRLKATETIGKSKESTFLGMEENVFFDVFGNGNVAVGDQQVYPVTDFTGDSQSPQLIGFSVSNTKVLTLYFDEPIDIASIDYVEQWSFQTTPNYIPTGVHSMPNTEIFPLTADGSQIIRYNALRTMLEVNIERDFAYMYGTSKIFSQIDAYWGLTIQDRVYFTATSKSIRDMAGNLLQPIDKENALEIGPTIWYWDLNLDAGLLVLTYTARSVDPHIELRAVNITSADDPSLYYTFQDAQYNFTRISDYSLHYQTYQVALQAHDMNGLKASGLISTVSNNLPASLLPSPDVMHYTPRLLLQAQFGVTVSTDSSDFIPSLKSIEIPASAPRAIRYFIPDTMAPECLGFTLDFNANQLRVHFSEAVDISTLVIPNIVLFSSTEGTTVEFPFTSLNFTRGSYVFDNITIGMEADSDMVLHFTSTTRPFHKRWDELKRSYLLSGRTLDSLLLRDGAIKDLSGNAIVGNTEIDPYPLLAIVDDVSPPEIESYVVDLDTYKLYVTFDDIVNVEDYQMGDNRREGSGIRMYLLPNETEAIQYLQSTFDGSTNTLFTNVDHLLSVGKIMLLSNFSIVEYVETNTGYNYRSISIDLSFLRNDQYEFERLYAQHLYQMNNAVSFYRDASSSVIAIQRATDWMGNAHAGFTVSTASEYIAHAALPVLEAYDFEDLTSSIQLTLYFSTMMRAANFSCTDWQLQDAQDGTLGSTTVLTWTDTDCTVITTADSRIMQFTVDANVVSGSNVGTVGSTWLTTHASSSIFTTTGTGASRDIYGNVLLTRDFSLASSMAVLPTALKDYNIQYYFGALQPGPRIIEASLDMNSGDVIVSFSKDIDISSFTNISTWVFQFNDAFAGDVRIPIALSATDIDPVTLQTIPDATMDTLTTFGPNGASSIAIKMTLTSNNLNRIKRLANNINPAPNVRRDLYIFATADTLLVDAALQQALVPLSVRINRFFPDTVAPQVRNATFHLGNEQLTLQFDEPVDKATFDVTKLFFQPLATEAHDYIPSENFQNGYIRLQNSGVATWSTNEDFVLINLTRHDANVLKNHPANLAVDADSLYLGVIPGALKDKAGNYIKPIPQENARRIEGFIQDMVSPFIAAFDLNMNVHPVELTIQFSEPMDVDSLNITSLILQSRFLSSAGVFHRLTGGTLRPSLFSSAAVSTSASSATLSSEIVVLELLDSDVNTMKRTGQLIRNKNAAFLRQEQFGRDVAGNVITPVFDNEALACRTFTTDAIPPRIVYTRVNMHTGEISFTFDEPTILGSVEVTGLTLVSKRPNKRFEDIQEADYFFYRLSSLSTSEISDNALFTTMYTNDTSLITNNADKSTLLSENITIVLADVDLNHIKRRYPLASSLETTFISVDRQFITDYVGNGVAPTDYVTSYAVQSYEIDRVRPSATSYSLQMNINDMVVVQLTFSECIDLGSLKKSVLYLQNFNSRRFGQFLNLNQTVVYIGRLPTDVSQLASNPFAVSMLREYVQERRLSAMGDTSPVTRLRPANAVTDTQECQTLTFLITDIDDIQTLRDASIGIDVTRAFLTFTEELIRDHAGNAVLPHYDGSVVNHIRYQPTNIKNKPYPPMTPTVFIPDTSPPSLTRWLYDQESHTMQLEFSEPIEIVNSTVLYLANTAFLRQSGQVSEFFQDFAVSKRYFHATHPPVLALPVFLNRMIEQKTQLFTSDETAVQWDYSQRSTRIRYVFNVSRDDFCLSWDYVRFVLSQGERVVTGPNRDIVLLNVTQLFYHDDPYAYANKSCTRNIFTGELEGLDFFAFLTPTEGDALKLIVASGYAVRDKSLAQNYMAGTIGKSQGRNRDFDAINSNYRVNQLSEDGFVPQSSPVCGACADPSSEYIVQNCTRLNDRVCASCRRCRRSYAYDVSVSSGSVQDTYLDNSMYTMFPCRGYMDTVCAPCKTCPYGTYIAQACTETSNTVCTPCATCQDNEYIVRPCVGGQNTQCASCLSCALLNEGLTSSRKEVDPLRIQVGHRTVSMVDFCLRNAKHAQRNRLWLEANCCVNADGTHVPCNSLSPPTSATEKTVRDGRSTSTMLREMAARRYQQLQEDTIRFDYEEISPIAAN